MNRRELLKYTAAVLGLSASSSLLAGAMAGGGSNGPKKSILGKDQRALVQTIAEIVIPKTDTPGAIEAGVPEFIDLIVSEWYTDNERQIFLAGLTDIDKYCSSEFKANFLACSPQQRNAALSHFEQLASAYKATPGSFFQKSSDEGTPFFSKIKELTIFGYYTSEVGATQELRYNMMPGQFIGDYPLNKVGRAWAN